MEEGPKTTHHIFEYINNKMRHGTTTQQLGNILAKDKEIRKTRDAQGVDGPYVASLFVGGRYKICEWDVTSEYRSAEEKRMAKLEEEKEE